MRCEKLEAGGGRLSRALIGKGEPIDSPGGFLELLQNCPTDGLVLGREELSPAFFELRSGLAGEILQKVSNYRRRLVILGDFSSTSSGALRDFIYESNRGGQVVFARDLEEALALLR